MAVTTAADFWALLDKSGILTASQQERARELGAAEADLKQLARALIKEGLLTVWQARQLLAGVSGLRLGKYKLLDEMGRSEIGRVYLAEHTQLVRRAALKLLARELSESPQTLQEFLKEARAISVLDHPHVVHTLDVASEGDRYYVVFEFVEGKDLIHSLPDEGGVDVARAVEWLRQAADGLAHAHENGVVHGDLKPANLMVDRQQQLKILDLGVARLKAALRSAAVTPTNVATPPEDPFRAPELLESPLSITPQSDLYSLGAIFFYMLTGRVPPAADPLVSEPADALLTQLAVTCPDLPDELVALAGQLLASDPAARLGTAADLQASLARWQATAAAQAAAASPAATAKPRSDEPRAERSAAESAGSGGRSDVSATPRPAPAKGATPPPRRGPAAARPPGARPAPARAPSDSRAAATSSSSFDIAKDAQAETEAATKTEESAAAETPSGTSDDDSSAAPLVFKTTPRRPGGKSSRPASRPKGSPSAVAAADAASAASSGKTSKKSAKIPLWVWLAGGAGGAGVLAVVGLVALFVWWGRDDGSAVAPGGQVATGSPGGTTGNGKTPAATNPAGTPVSPDTAGTSPAPAGTDLLANKPDSTNGASGTTPPGNSPPGSDTPADPAVPAPQPDEKAVAAAPMPMPPQPVTPPTPVEPKPEPKPDPAPPAPEAKPEPKPEPKPAPPPAAIDPFQQFAPQFVELPLPSKEGGMTEPFVLGKIQLSGNALLIIHLLGGEGAIKGKFLFTLDAAEGGTAERDWEIMLREGDASAAGTKIAHLTLQDNELRFRWEEAASGQPAAPHLMNCMLQFSAGPKQHAVALRKPLEVEPLKAEVLKGLIRGKWEIPYPPNVDKLRVELAFSGPFPPAKFDGQMPLDGDKGKVLVWFGPSQEEQTLALRVDTALRKFFEIGFDPHFRVGTTGKPEKLSASTLAKAQNFVLVGQRQAFAALGFQKEMSKGKNDEATQQRLAAMEANVTSMQKAVQQLAALKQLADTLAAEGQVHVRVFCQVDDKTVDLVRTANMPPSGK